MDRSTFSLRDFLRDNKNVEHDLASSSIRNTSISDSGIPKSISDIDIGYTDRYDRELEGKICDIYKGRTDTVVLPGAQISNSLIYLSLFKPGDEVLVESPNYSPLQSIPERIGLKTRTIPRTFEDEFKLNVDDIDRSITENTKALVITNPHNPSGIFMDKKEILNLQRYLKGEDILLVVDEIFRDFIGESSSAALSGDNVVITSSLSKIFGMGGLRIGWVVSQNQEVIEKIYRMKYHLNLLNSTLSEKAALDVFENQESLLKEVRGLAQRNLSMVKGWVTGSEYLEWVPPSSCIISFPRLKIDCDSYDFSKMALKQGVLVTPGLYFSDDDTWSKHIRLCYGIETDVLAVGLQKLSKVFRQWD